MPAMDWTAIFSGMDIPVGYVMVAFIVTSVLNFLLGRGTSKDKTNSSMLEQTIKRQKELDERQGEMMDDLQNDFRTVRSDMGQIRQELSEERKRFNALSEKYSTLSAENFNLRQLVKNLTSEKDLLKTALEELQTKNRDLTDELMEMNNRMES